MELCGYILYYATCVFRDNPHDTYQVGFFLLADRAQRCSVCFTVRALSLADRKSATLRPGARGRDAAELPVNGLVRVHD